MTTSQHVSILRVLIAGIIIVIVQSIFIYDSHHQIFNVTSNTDLLLIDVPPRLGPRRHQQLGQRIQNHRKRHIRRLMILAAAPRDVRHLYTLWTELECFTVTTAQSAAAEATDGEVTLDILLAVPDWSKGIIEPFLDVVRSTIPHFGPSGRTKIMVRYFINDRYDVGLWCDGIESMEDHDDDHRHHKMNNRDSSNKITGFSSISDYDQYALLNDSVFALKPFTGIFDVLTERNVSLSSTSYSLTGKKFFGYGMEHYWVESIFRGFDRHGLEVFRKHSCLPPDDPAFCPNESRKRRKECIVDYFEHDLASKFDDISRQVYGFYLADVVWRPGINVTQTWARNFVWWQLLVRQGFPIVKADGPNVIYDPYTHPLLGNCTRYLQQELSTLSLNFSLATDSLTTVLQK